MVQVPVRLSSEMDNSVTVQYATQDGTAQAGLDYTATSGTLTFAPHERVRTVSVPVNDDVLREPSETFFLNLSGESSGTMIDGQAVVTILDRPIGPPPPGPPPPPPPPPPIEPPPPQPPPPPVRCFVPRVVGMTLRRAKSRIRARHCGVGRVRYARARRVGKVIAQSPRPGTRKPRGFKVRLVVGPALERVAEDGQPPRPLGGDVEAGLTAFDLSLRGEPGLGGQADAPLFLRIDHLGRIAQLAARLGLHLAEHDEAPTARDDVELVTGDPHVRREDPEPAEAVVPERAALGSRSDRAGVTPR